MCLFHRFRWRACTNYVLVTLHRRYNTPNALARQQISTFHPQLTCYSRPGVWTKIRAFSIRQKTQSFRIPHAYIFPYAHQSRVNAVQTSTNKIVEKKNIRAWLDLLEMRDYSRFIIHSYCIILFFISLYVCEGIFISWTCTINRRACGTGSANGTN